MMDLPHLASVFDRLKRGYHLGPDEDNQVLWRPLVEAA